MEQWNNVTLYQCHNARIEHWNNRKMNYRTMEQWNCNNITM